MYPFVLKWFAILVGAFGLLLAPTLYVQKQIKTAKAEGYEVGYGQCRTEIEQVKSTIRFEMAVERQAEAADAAERLKDAEKAVVKVKTLEKRLQDATAKNVKLSEPVFTADLVQLWRDAAAGTSSGTSGETKSISRGSSGPVSGDSTESAD